MGKLLLNGGKSSAGRVVGYEYSIDGRTWSEMLPVNAGYAATFEPQYEPTVNTQSWNTTNVSNTVTEASTGRKAPIPTGFVASGVEGENTIAGGLVIYEGTAEVNSSNHSNALENRDQFVWIPVDDINNMVMCTGSMEDGVAKQRIYARTIDNKENKSIMYSKVLELPVEDAKCHLVQDENGKLYCETHMGDSNPNNYFLCGKLYTENNIGESFLTDGTYNTAYSANLNLREPAVITGTDETSYDAASNNYHGYGTGTTGANAFLEQLKGDFAEMAESVAIYGGFYISRYEVGYDSTSYISRKGQTVMNSNTASRWYGLYSHIKEYNKSSVTSSMIWRMPI